MSRWIDGWMNEWMDGWFNRWMNGWMHGWDGMDGWMDGMNRCMEWMDGWMEWIGRMSRMGGLPASNLHVVDRIITYTVTVTTFGQKRAVSVISA